MFLSEMGVVYLSVQAWLAPIPVFESLITSVVDHINIETLDFNDDSVKPRNLGMAFVNLLADTTRFRGKRGKFFTIRYYRLSANPRTPTITSLATARTRRAFNSRRGSRSIRWTIA